ncbi:MAG: hypothetical protein ACR2KP_13825 [Egibacteraceae bacterium]
MTRRDLTIAAITITLGATIALLVATLGGDDDRGDGSPGQAIVTLTGPRPGGTTTTPPDPGAARAAIQATATAYQRALNPDSTDDPCNYLTDHAQVLAVNGAPGGTAAEGCTPSVARGAEQQRRDSLTRVRAIGIDELVFFAPRRDAAPSDIKNQEADRPGDAGARAIWKGAPRRVVYFTEQPDGSWLIDE